MTQLVKIKELKTGKESWLNPHYIIALVPMGVGFDETKIIVSGIKDGIIIRESCETLLAMINTNG